MRQIPSSVPFCTRDNWGLMKLTTSGSHTFQNAVLYPLHCTAFLLSWLQFWGQCLELSFSPEGHFSLIVNGKFIHEFPLGHFLNPILFGKDGSFWSPAKAARDASSRWPTWDCFHSVPPLPAVWHTWNPGCSPCYTASQINLSTDSKSTQKNKKQRK